MSAHYGYFMTRILLLAAALSGLLAGPAAAEKQIYNVTLGRRPLGSLQFEGQGSNATLRLSLDNTPFGLDDGTFEAVTQAKGNEVDYLGTSRGSETRDIAIVRKADTVTAVTITPHSEMTEMTDARKVPPGVISPTEFFAKLANSKTCPSPMAMYDGRRVIQMATTAKKQNDDTVICDMSYKVAMGPGYVFPFYFKSFDVQLAYTARKLATFAMSAGGFTVRLIRQ
ncbi:hypothetical protein DEM26_12640 [Thioclava sp. NG1]|nr:hypothetical protein DEM26_12640 [Thioclava sp. NG1]